MLLVALLDPFEVEAEVGLSRTHRDRYVAFNRTFNCTTDGTFSPEPLGWQVRADFHLNENVWELLRHPSSVWPRSSVVRRISIRASVRVVGRSAGCVVRARASASL